MQCHVNELACQAERFFARDGKSLDPGMVVMKDGLVDGVAGLRLLAGMELGSGMVKVAVALLCRPL